MASKRTAASGVDLALRPMMLTMLYSCAPCPVPSNGLPKAAAKLRASVIWLLLIKPRTRRQASA